jgi:hypothetical protein
MFLNNLWDYITLQVKKNHGTSSDKYHQSSPKDGIYFDYKPKTGDLEINENSSSEE